MRVVSAFLCAGFPLSKSACCRHSLEENGYCLTDRRHVFNYFPFVLEGTSRIYNEVAKTCLSDRASVHNVAMHTIPVVFPHMLHTWCFSHILNHVKEKMYDTSSFRIHDNIAWSFPSGPKAQLQLELSGRAEHAHLLCNHMVEQVGEFESSDYYIVIGDIQPFL